MIYQQFSKKHKWNGTNDYIKKKSIYYWKFYCDVSDNTLRRVAVLTSKSVTGISLTQVN